MRNRILLFTTSIFLINGCGLLPYKSEFDCRGKPSGHCGSLSDNIKEAYEIAGLTSSNNCVDCDIEYEINEITYSPKIVHRKYYKKHKKRQTKRRKKKVCKYVYY